MRGLVLGAITVLFLMPALGLAQEPISREIPALLTADEISYDETLGVVVASGHVEISQGQRLLLADTVTYNQRTNVVTASGNVSLLEPSGEVIFADYAELTDDMREGVMRSIRILLTDRSRFAAVSGWRSGGNRTEMRKAVFSPCELCEEDPTRAPLWQIRAFKVVHDQKAQDIEYYDAWLEMFGVPVAYTPYFSHPDPTVVRRSGFLVPDFGNNSRLGLFTRTPYYFNIAPDKGLTVTPTFTTKERAVLAAEYRQRFNAGEIDLSGSVTRVRQRDSQGERKEGDQTRGHIFGNGRFDIDRTWRTGADLALATDDTFLRRYNVTTTDVLTSRAFVEGFRGRNYAAANAFHFQGLRATDDSAQIPFILSTLDYNHVGEPDRLGGRWSLDTNGLVLLRTGGTDSRRLSLKAGWQLPYTSSIGEVYTLSFGLQGDGYLVDDFIDPGTGARRDGLTGRLFPQAALEWRFPFVREDGNWREFIEPVAALVVAPNGGNPGKIPNEDSQNFEFDDTNLFSLNRFPGLDRVDGGQRVVYGLKGGIYNNTGGSATAFLGQSFRFREDDTFANDSGLEKNLSDFVGRVQFSPVKYVDLLYRSRLGQTNLDAKRNEVDLALGPPALRLNLDYVFFKQTGTTTEFEDREEILLSLSSRVTEFWSVAVRHRRDLTANGGALQSGASLTYADECFLFTVDLTRSFTRDRDIEPSDTILFRLVFKYLGQVQTAQQLQPESETE